MAITSRNDSPRLGRYGRTQFRYATVYVCVTFLVLLLLNLYTTQTSQELFCQGKESAMVERCNLAAGEFAELEVFSPATVSAAVSQMGTLRLSRMMVTDIAGVVIYDSADSALGKTGLLPEIVAALGSNDVFSWQYYEGAMHSRAAVPIYSYGTMIGAVYMAEYDSSQGALMQSLQSNILSITLALEVVLILFSMFYAGMFSRRLRRIMDSMAEIRKGDYSQKVKMGGNDELTILGNEFNRLSERLQTSEKKRQQFVSDASHELKTPLASIKLLSDSILQNEMDMDTVREFVGDIGSEADRLNRMSQKLLSLSRIEGEEDEDCEILDICPTVSWGYVLFRGRVPDRISHSLYLVEILTLLSLLCAWYAQERKGLKESPVLLEQKGRKAISKLTEQENRKKAGGCLIVPAVLLLYLLVNIPGTVHRVQEEQKVREQRNQPYEQLKAYCEGNAEQYYYVDVRSTVYFSEKMFEKIDNSKRNYDIIGGWACKSPVSPKEDMVFFLTKKGKDMIWLEELLTEQEPGMTVVMEEELSDWDVYKIVPDLEEKSGK